jgi:hypothetical protein
MKDGVHVPTPFSALKDSSLEWQEQTAASFSWGSNFTLDETGTDCRDSPLNLLPSIHRVLEL